MSRRFFAISRARCSARRHARLAARLGILTLLVGLLSLFSSSQSIVMAQDALPAGAPVAAASLCLVPPAEDNYGSISGTVIAAAGGAPIAGVLVRGNDRFGRTFLQDQTTITGTYTLDFVYPGDYTVSFTTNADALTTPYVAQVHDGVSTLGQATLIHVALGQDVTGIDAALVVGAEISGRVTDQESGLPLEDVSVTIYAAAHPNTSLATVRSDASGNYRFRAGFAPGNYLLFFFSADHSMEWFDGVPDDESATPVTITGTQAKVVNASMVALEEAPEGRITGRITIAANGNPLPGARITPDGQDVYALDRIGTADAQGYFTLTVPVGTYKLRASRPLSGGDYASRYFGPDASYVNAVTFEVEENQTAANKNIALEEGFYIEGTVSLPGGAPADVVFVQAYEGPGVLESGFTYSTQTDPDGAYSLGPLPRIPFNLYVQPPSSLCNLVAQTITVDPDEAVAAAVVDVGLVEGMLLSGRVTNAVGGDGVGSAFVRAYDANGAIVTGGSTAGTGYYLLPALPAGSYRVGFDEDGFADQYYDNKPSLATASVVAGAVGQGILGIDAALSVDSSGGSDENGVYIPIVVR